ncbi:MFS transporter [Roseomonas xinghualingensis]|uniref:MFS transporter n=1 Tax=Roseomonas xinghualingensis TaxID=2986475 RepID=UPI0021F1189F|nr:MFS transporter [Roseomonas sp. SXEYE001]MCV4206854.1 MFS transporter [Roseomonas sp. SXEYE001]
MAEAPVPGATRWREIIALIAAGIAAAIQLGKVAPSLLAIGESFGIGLEGAAGLISVFSLMAAVGGLMAGLLAARTGARRSLLVGLWTLGGAGLAAAAAPSVAVLYAVRLLEGAAFLAVVISAPTLINRRAAPADRGLAMSAWGVFMPAGVALGVLGAPLVEAQGWRIAWAVAALIPFGAAVLVGALMPRWAAPPVPASSGLPGQVAKLWRARSPFLVAGCFSCYAVLYFGLAGFLPARLVQGFGLSLSSAGLAGAAAAIANIAGNLTAAVLIRLGWHPAAMLGWAGAAMTILTAAALALPVSPTLSIAAALLASALGGLIPASLFALAPRAVPEPALVGPGLGLLVQFNNVGQVLGPIAIAAAAGRSWSLTAIPLLLVGAALLAMAPRLRRIDQ